MDINKTIKKSKAKLLLIVITYGIIGIVAIFLVAYITKYNGEVPYPVVAGVLIWCLGLIDFKKEQDKALKIYKEAYVNECCKQEFDTVSYYPEKGIEENKVLETNLFKNQTVDVSTEDLIKGTYKNVNFELSDVILTNKNSGDTPIPQYIYPFYGQWYVFDFNKNFHDNLLIIDNKYKTIFNHTNLNSQNESIKETIEDLEFNNQFSIYAENAENVFYILTPQLIEKIKDLKSKTKGNLLIFFKESKLYIGINSMENMFQNFTLESVNLEEDKKYAIKDLDNIKTIIDTLELNKNLFKK